MGFAGDTLAAVRIVNALDEYDVQYLTFEKILKILRDRAQEVEALPLGVRFLVGGRGRKGGFQMATLGQRYRAMSRTSVLLSRGPISSRAPAPIPRSSAVGAVPAGRCGKLALPGRRGGFHGCRIQAAAERDETVNTKSYRQLIL